MKTNQGLFHKDYNQKKIEGLIESIQDTGSRSKMQVMGLRRCLLVAGVFTYYDKAQLFYRYAHNSIDGLVSTMVV